MLNLCCTLPNCKRRFATDKGLYQHKKQDPRHNRHKSYDSYNEVGNKRHFPIQYLALWNNNAYIAYKMVTPAPKSLLGLHDKSDKHIPRINKISHKPTMSSKFSHNSPHTVSFNIIAVVLYFKLLDVSDVRSQHGV